jgi:hypothetical protein
VDDIVVPGVTHLVLVRSPHAHARVAAVDTHRARKVAGVIDIVTAAELGPMPALPVNRLFRDMIVPPNPLLAGERVHAQGTPVAAVVAESRPHWSPWGTSRYPASRQRRRRSRQERRSSSRTRRATVRSARGGAPATPTPRFPARPGASS